MKRLSLLSTWLLIMILTVLSPIAVAETLSLPDITYQAGSEGETISLWELGNNYYFLFLPSFADLTALSLQLGDEPAVLTAADQSITISSGEPFDLTSLYSEIPSDGVYPFTLSRDSESIFANAIVSGNIGSMYITSADPENAGKKYVEETKGNKASGQITLLRADGSTVYTGELKQIKGRGNTTWGYPKKPYQIKLREKIDLLETGDSDEAASTWILLANYWDRSLFRNALTYDLAAELGLAYSPNSRSVDLYYDGKYRGTYLLCEKTEVATGRVDIHNLEKDFEKANAEVEDFDELPTEGGDKPYQYVMGLNDPDDLSGGYLLELDFPNRAKAEKSYFVTDRDYYVVSKSPEYLSENAIVYIREFYQEFEDAVFNGGVNPKTGKSYTDYVDLESLAKCHAIFELVQNADAYRSSTFFYKPAGEEKLYAGPVWDFDSAYGLYDAHYEDTMLASKLTSLGQALMKIPSFCQAVEDVYQNEIYPLINDIVLNPDTSAAAGHVRSIANYSEELALSFRMGSVLWTDPSPMEYDVAVEFLRDFIARRNEFLYNLHWETALSSEG